MKRSIIILFVMGGSFLASCTGYAPHSIDEKPQVKTDENFFGIWKAVEDTNRLDYILVNSVDDINYTVDEIRRDYGSILRHEQYIDSVNDYKIGVDTVYTIKELLKLEEEAKPLMEYQYHLTRFDNNGSNPHYWAFGAYASKIGNATFLNVDYWQDTSGKNERETGYFFVRLLKVTPDTIITAVVSDRSMRTLTSSKAVREMIEKNLNNKAFYKDTVYLYKVKGGHFSFDESSVLANK